MRGFFPCDLHRRIIFRSKSRSDRKDWKRKCQTQEQQLHKMCIRDRYIADAAVIAEGLRYLQISVYCYIFYGLSLIGANILRSIGQVKVPLYTAILAFFINVGFNYVFIFGKLGFPAMGTKGAALGTLFARILEFGITFGYLLCNCLLYTSDAAHPTRIRERKQKRQTATIR